MVWLLGAVCVLVCWLIVRDDTGSCSLPDKNKVNPLHFAVLRSGWQAAIDVTVVRLMERGIIGFQDIKENVLWVKVNTSELSQVEKVIYDYLRTPKGKEDFRGEDIQNAMENSLQPVYQELASMRLYKTPKQIKTTIIIVYSMIVCLELFIMFQANMGHWRLGLLVFVPLLILYVFRPHKRITSLGNRYIKEVTNHFNWMRTSIALDHKTGFVAINVVLGMAIFGLEILPLVSNIAGCYKDFVQSDYRVPFHSLSSGDSLFSLDGGKGYRGGCGGGSYSSGDYSSGDYSSGDYSSGDSSGGGCGGGGGGCGGGGD